MTDLDTSPGIPADHAAIDATSVWTTTVEDEDEIVEAVRMGGQDMMTGKVLDSGVAGCGVSDNESERGDSEGTGVGAIAEPLY